MENEHELHKEQIGRILLTSGFAKYVIVTPLSSNPEGSCSFIKRNIKSGQEWKVTIKEEEV